MKTKNKEVIAASTGGTGGGTAKSVEVLRRMIDERLAPGASTEDIDARIWKLFGERWAVVFTDMAGFSRRAARQGIIPFLVLIHQMERIVTPIVDKNAGFLLKKIADSHLILFRDPETALATCIEMQRAIERYNDGAAEADQLFLGCGIGWGDVLKLGDEDVYGVEVNFAAKLGEDLAGPYEIFLTPDAVDAIGKKVKGTTFKKVPGGELGGTKLPYYEATYDLKSTGTKKKAKAGHAPFK